MSSSPSVLVENQESPPAPADQAASNSANSSTNSNGTTTNTSSPPVQSESKVPPPLLQPQKSGSGHRRRFNSSQQQPLFPQAQYPMDPMIAGVYDPRINPNYYPSLYSYGTDFTDIWNGAGASFVTDPSLWNGALQSPNDIVFAYPPQYHSFGFASPEGMAVTGAPTPVTLGAPASFAYDIPSTGQLQPGQPQQGGQTSPMVNGAFTDTLHQRLREMTLSGSDAGQNDGERLDNKGNRSSNSNDDSASRTWASVASAQSQQNNAWNGSSGGRNSANLRGGPVVLDVARSGVENDHHLQQNCRNDMTSERNMPRQIAGILPYNPHRSPPDQDLSQAPRSFGTLIEPRPMYNPQHIQHAQSSMAEELCRKNDYNPKEFKIETTNARFFIIKSFAEDDVFASVKYSVWCSTVRGNERLDRAFRTNEGPIYLFFSVNNTGNFCGIAQMVTPVDFQKDAGCWSTPRWKGAFSVKWVYIKDIPFREFKEITLDNNEGKPVFKSRDTQEILPSDLGMTMLKIFHNYRSQTTLFDDFTYYEEKAATNSQSAPSVTTPATNQTGGSIQQPQQAQPPQISQQQQAQNGTK